MEFLVDHLVVHRFPHAQVRSLGRCAPCAGARQNLQCRHDRRPQGTHAPTSLGPDARSTLSALAEQAHCVEPRAKRLALHEFAPGQLRGGRGIGKISVFVTAPQTTMRKSSSKTLFLPLRQSTECRASTLPPRVSPPPPTSPSDSPAIHHTDQQSCPPALP